MGKIYRIRNKQGEIIGAMAASPDKFINIRDGQEIISITKDCTVYRAMVDMGPYIYSSNGLLSEEQAIQEYRDWKGFSGVVAADDPEQWINLMNSCICEQCSWKISGEYNDYFGEWEYECPNCGHEHSPEEIDE